MRDKSAMQRTDVMIAGGGVTGLTLALLLKRALGGTLRVTLCDPMIKAAPMDDDRAFALAADGRRLFDRLGIWPMIEEACQPITEMVITDSRLDDPVRPVFLTFGGEIAPGESFAQMVPQGLLIEKLLFAADQAGVQLISDRVKRFKADGSSVAVMLAGGDEMKAGLLVGSDGGQSAIRELAGINFYQWSYKQAGIVMTIGHERPHDGQAEEHFLPAGPFARLPLTGNRSSLVWTEAQDRVGSLLDRSDAALIEQIERRAGLKLGVLSLLSRPRAYPLNFGIARRFIGERLALVGDAAHMVHPIAGQGLNIGLRDVAVLAERIIEAAGLGLDIGTVTVLDAYEKARRFDAVLFGAVTDGLNRLFSNDHLTARLARDLGLGIVDRMGPLKKRMIRRAAGITPSRARGTGGSMCGRAGPGSRDGRGLR
jgi:2-octaprenyl-6-methoxyphenol hydroxylase